MTKTSLRISEIFYSLQGEGLSTGVPTVFVRLTGCPLRCQYCDTSYAFQGGQSLSVEQVLARIGPYHCQTVCVTGGEPLAQKNCLVLLRDLCDNGYAVSLETSGAMDLAGVDSRVVKVMDLKTPASGEAERNRWENLQQLSRDDQIKLVICDRGDYDWAVQILQQHQLQQKCTVLFSPAYGQQDPAQLAQWILDDALPVRFQLQLHKSLWGEAQGR
ncbi:MAG: 7-carboxy-7-deazaguanine synthase QueE [Gammaproteobacteria bacterium]|nr:7-carboxy-7-deazaguanine synthase QueE [Gammaproteobacteria bacterium]MDH5801432.1 7-carboxy-7-deazaguanine synthase QueE [Gammaproteobacteria bacterium]